MSAWACSSNGRAPVLQSGGLRVRISPGPLCHLFRRVVNRHRHKSPSEILSDLLYESRQLVANTEALTAAVAANEAAVAANTTAVTAAVDKITNDPTQAAVDAAVTQVQADTTQVEANTTALDNAVTPPAPVPPVEG